jgi:hypothetical protein
MSIYGNPGSLPPAVPPAAPSLPPGNVLAPPGPPKVDMSASAEMQAWLRRLQAEERKLGTRNKYLTVTLAAGVVLLLVVLGGVHRATIGTYAVLDDVRIEQHPVDQGRVEISFRVVSPGKVYCRRISGGNATDVIDYFAAPAEVTRPWSWAYQPGENIEVALWYRSGLLPRKSVQSFPTLGRADVVILIDTTESMDSSIAALKEKCVAFSEKLDRQALKHRFALLAFGDTKEGDWLERRTFTEDASQFRRWVAGVKRFKGGDLPESALDALEEALRLPLDDGAVRHFYLVTDADYHAPTQLGATPAAIARRLEEKRVLLRVFSRAQFEESYRKLLGDTGRFDEIENFSKVLGEGRLLED